MQDSPLFLAISGCTAIGIGAVAHLNIVTTCSGSFQLSAVGRNVRRAARVPLCLASTLWSRFLRFLP
jgi:hypothetical protein